MRVAATLLALLALLVLLGAPSEAQTTNTRALVAGEVLINVYVMGADKTNINDIRIKIAEKLSAQVNRFESGAVSFVSKTETLFQFIITAGSDPSALKLAQDAEKLSKDEVRAMGIDRPPTIFVTTPAPPPPQEESSTMRTVLIVGGAALSGALLALIVAALFCKPRSTEAEERKQKEKQQETIAKMEAEMQVQQLVRSAAFQRLQERVIGLEKDEALRKAIDEVEETTKKNRGVAKQVARELLDEPFVEPQDRARDKGASPSATAAAAALNGGEVITEAEARRRRAIDLVENAPWWHNAAIQAEITADLAMPQYVGLHNKDDDDDDDDLIMGGNRSGGGGGGGRNAESRNLARAERAKKRRGIAKIPDNLYDYSAVTLIAAGHHWLSHTELPKMQPQIASIVMLAKSNLHGVGVFARRFIDRGTLLFPYANPSQVNTEKHIYTANEMRFHFGNNWDVRLHFVARDGFNKKFCVCESPRERGWGCCINSARGTGNMLVANCECVFPEDRRAGIVPWVRVTQTIAPLGELLLDYPFPELIIQQRGLDPDAIDNEPPPVSFSTYGASLKIPLLSAAAAPMPRQTLELPPPPPPPPLPADTPPSRALSVAAAARPAASAPSAAATDSSGASVAVPGLLDLPPPPPPTASAQAMDDDDLLPAVRVPIKDDSIDRHDL